MRPRLIIMHALPDTLIAQIAGLRLSDVVELNRDSWTVRAWRYLIPMRHRHIRYAENIGNRTLIVL